MNAADKICHAFSHRKGWATDGGSLDVAEGDFRRREAKGDVANLVDVGRHGDALFTDPGVDLVRAYPAGAGGGAAAAILFPEKMTLKRFILICFILSFTKELFQFLFNVGMFNIDDIILNVVGGILSYILLKKMMI